MPRAPEDAVRTLAPSRLPLDPGPSRAKSGLRTRKPGSLLPLVHANLGEIDKKFDSRPAGLYRQSTAVI